MIRITPNIAIDENEIDETFIRATGPGGQNVNKVATAVQLRFDVRNSPSLGEGVRARLEKLAGSRLTNDGVLVLTVRTHRTQERNRQEALNRLSELIQRAATPPTPRRPTRASTAERRRRLEAKGHRSKVKALRTTPGGSD